MRADDKVYDVTMPRSALFAIALVSAIFGTPIVGRAQQVVGACDVRLSSGAACPPGVLDSALAALVRSTITTSLVGGGGRPSVYVAADSVSADLLQRIGLSAEPPNARPGLVCPGSTDSAGRSFDSPTGYVVDARLDSTADGDVWTLAVEKTCLFIFQGQPPRGRFAEFARWELRRAGAGWSAHMRSHGIT